MGAGWIRVEERVTGSCKRGNEHLVPDFPLPRRPLLQGIIQFISIRSSDLEQEVLLSDMKNVLTHSTWRVKEGHPHKQFYIHGSVYRDSTLIRSNKMQQLFIYCKYTLRVSGVHRTYHQEYIKL